MNNQKVIHALLTIAEKAKSGTLAEPDFGICMNLTVELTGDSNNELGYALVSDFCQLLKVSNVRPIPRSNSNGDPYWQGRQLELRLDFISKMVTYLEVKDAQENCSSETI